MHAYSDARWPAERVAGERSGMLANTAACWRTRRHVGEYGGVLANTAACWRTWRHVGERGGMLANTVACWHARSCDCQHSRLHAFTRASAHTATAARMVSGETAFIDGNF